jgi:hypothetical protein
LLVRSGFGTIWVAGLLLAGSAAAQAPAPAATPVPAPAAPATTAPAPVPAAAAPAASPTPAPPAWKPFQEFAFLSGAWAGSATVGTRVGGRVARFGPEIGGAFFVEHASTILAAEEGGRPEETLDEQGLLSYDREKRRYVATWFFSNGVSAVLDVELLPDGFRLVSREVVNYESGTRMRILFQRQPAGDVAMSVDLAGPGRDFTSWLVSGMKKR